MIESRSKFWLPDGLSESKGALLERRCRQSCGATMLTDPTDDDSHYTKAAATVRTDCPSCNSVRKGRPNQHLVAALILAMPIVSLTCVASKASQINSQLNDEDVADFWNM